MAAPSHRNGQFEHGRLVMGMTFERPLAQNQLAVFGQRVPNCHAWTPWAAQVCIENLARGVVSECDVHEAHHLGRSTGTSSNGCSTNDADGGCELATVALADLVANCAANDRARNRTAGAGLEFRPQPFLRFDDRPHPHRLALVRVGCTSGQEGNSKHQGEEFCSDHGYLSMKN